MYISFVRVAITLLIFFLQNSELCTISTFILWWFHFIFMSLVWKNCKTRNSTIMIHTHSKISLYEVLHEPMGRAKQFYLFAVCIFDPFALLSSPNQKFSIFLSPPSIQHWLLRRSFLNDEDDFPPDLGSHCLLLNPSRTKHDWHIKLLGVYSSKMTFAPKVTMVFS